MLNSGESMVHGHSHSHTRDDTKNIGTAFLLNFSFTIVGSVLVLVETIPRIINLEETNALGMIGFAALGIVVNGLAVLRVRRGRSLNAQVVAWHLLEDALGWLAVLVASIVITFTEIYILDPILTILISIYILYNVLKTWARRLRFFYRGF